LSSLFLFLFLTVLNESRYTHLPVTVAIVPHTVTTDVQQVTVSRGDNQSVEVECLFLQGSEALGCYVELTQDNEQMIRDRISRLNNSFVARGEIALDLALSCYKVYIYDWEADSTTGTVPIPVEISYVNSISVERCRTTVSPPPTELPMSGVFRQAEFSTQLHPTYLKCGNIYRVGLYTELFYAIIPTLFLYICFFADLLSLHVVTLIF